MKTQSTYSLLLNAEREEKGRSVFSAVILSLVVATMALSGWQFASTKLTMPDQARAAKTPEVMIAAVPADQAPLLASSN
jgi:hypothetical protein